MLRSEQGLRVDQNGPENFKYAPHSLVANPHQSIVSILDGISATHRGGEMGFWSIFCDNCRDLMTHKTTRKPLNDRLKPNKIRSKEKCHWNRWAGKGVPIFPISIFATFAR